MNPNAWIIRGKSLEQMIQNHLKTTDNIIDEYILNLIDLMDDTRQHFEKTHMTLITDNFRDRRKQQTIEAQKYTNEKILSK